MKLRCLLGHSWRDMPRLMELEPRRPGPKKACTRCGALKYDYVMFVPSPERSLFSNLGPHYEGQTPPKGFDSWSEYHKKIRDDIQKTLRKMR